MPIKSEVLFISVVREAADTAGCGFDWSWLCGLWESGGRITYPES